MMLHLHVRTSTLSQLLLILLLAMATDGELTCEKQISVSLIRDLWSQTRQLINTLPKEANVSKYSRLLPTFCTSCAEHPIGWLEVRWMIDIYQSSVFNREVIQRRLPLHYGDLLYRLQHTLKYCVSSSQPSKWLKTIMKLKRKIKKGKGNEGVIKAAGEFTFILRWISELMQ